MNKRDRDFMNAEIAEHMPSNVREFRISENLRLVVWDRELREDSRVSTEHSDTGGHPWVSVPLRKCDLIKMSIACKDAFFEIGGSGIDALAAIAALGDSECEGP